MKAHIPEHTVPKSALDEQMAELMNKMVTIQESTQAAVKDLQKKMTDLERRQQTAKDKPAVANRGEGKDTFKCFNCGGQVHISMYCLKPRQGKPGKGTLQQQPLNN